jgi:hypothetical protein
MFEHIYTVGDLEFAERELSAFAKVLNFDYKNRNVKCCDADAETLKRRMSHYEFVDGEPTHMKIMMDAWKDIDFGDKWQWVKAVNKYATHGFYRSRASSIPR